jgi:glycosyltransferase involved in cell wall biosynthesis
MSVSVVMAVYNGERFISKQVKSILCQLSVGDELIIIDDCSLDSSLEIIAQFESPHVKVVRNHTNIGVIKSFERGLAMASNEFIFLSDQDDIWAHNKISTYLNIFADPSINIIVSDAQVIDSFDKVISDSFMKDFLGGFSPLLYKNFIKNRFLGCTIGMRSSVCDFILPFPRFISMHDIYIGIASVFVGGVRCVDSSVFYYRRHDGNVTSVNSINISFFLLNRFKYIYALSHLLFKFIYMKVAVIFR